MMVASRTAAGAGGTSGGTSGGPEKSGTKQGQALSMDEYFDKMEVRRGIHFFMGDKEECQDDYLSMGRIWYQSSVTLHK